MSVKVASNRFILSSKYTALYQQIIGNISNFQKLGQWLTAQAGELQAFRRIEGLKSVAEVLAGLPLKEYHLIGQYYLAWCGYRENKDVRSELEAVIEQSKTYRGKALLSLAAVEAGNYDLELKLYKEAAKWGNHSIVAQAARGIAIVKAREGGHRQAVNDLETIAGFTRATDPIAYFQYLNSFAVELGEVGRVEEAQNVCRIVLASPYINAYPEWRETGQDLTLRGYKSRSSIPIIRTIPIVRKVRENVLYMSEHERSEGHRPSPFDQPRDISTIAGWKEKKMVKEPNGENDNVENIDEMDDKDLLATLIQLAAREGVDEEKLRDVVKYAVKTLVTSKKK